MTESDIDPQSRLRYADDILSTAAQQLESLLREAAQLLRPFPPFPGAFFTYGVEVEVAQVQDTSVGCVVVTEDGSLMELQISLDDDPSFGQADPVSMRDEQLVEVELAPHDRLLFAYEGLRLITGLLREARLTAREAGSEQDASKPAGGQTE
jgi:hypothetical protein